MTAAASAALIALAAACIVYISTYPSKRRAAKLWRLRFGVGR